MTRRGSAATRGAHAAAAVTTGHLVALGTAGRTRAHTGGDGAAEFVVVEIAARALEVGLADGMVPVAFEVGAWESLVERPAEAEGRLVPDRVLDVLLMLRRAGGRAVVLERGRWHEFGIASPSGRVAGRVCAAELDGQVCLVVDRVEGAAL